MSKKAGDYWLKKRAATVILKNSVNPRFLKVQPKKGVLITIWLAVCASFFLTINTLLESWSIKCAYVHFEFFALLIHSSGSIKHVYVVL